MSHRTLCFLRDLLELYRENMTETNSKTIILPNVRYPALVDFLKQNRYDETETFFVFISSF